MIDTHTHYNSKDIKNLEVAIENFNNSDNTGAINIGLNLETSKEVITISNNNVKFYATIGIHPLYKGNVEDIRALYYNSNNSKILAIGETGLDNREYLDNQIPNFIRQIELANDLQLPLVIHSKGENRRVIEILKRWTPLYGFVVHCFQPNLKTLEDIVKLGGYISVATPIIKSTANKSLKVIKAVPKDRLLIELDYPYLSDNPSEDGKQVFNKIKELWNMSKPELEAILDTNAKQLFKKLK